MAPRSTQNNTKKVKKGKPPVPGPRSLSFFGFVLLFFVGLALMPISVGLVRSLLAAERALNSPAFFGMSSAVGMFAFGFLLFGLMYSIFRIPALPYVFGHELTHVLFGLFSGARISDFKVRRDKGSVTVSQGGLLMVLSPYFFPIYLVIFLFLFWILSALFPVHGSFAGNLLAGLVGVAWGFHFCFTLNAMLQRQTDLEIYGFFFSCSFILLLNLVVLCIVFVVISPIGFREMAIICRDVMADSLLWFWNHLWNFFWKLNSFMEKAK